MGRGFFKNYLLQMKNQISYRVLGIEGVKTENEKDKPASEFSGQAFFAILACFFSVIACYLSTSYV